MPAGYGCDQCGRFITVPRNDEVMWQVARHCGGSVGLFGQTVPDTQTFFFCSLRCLGVWAAARPEFDTAPAPAPGHHDHLGDRP